MQNVKIEKQTSFSVVIKQQTTVTDKVKHRLEQLDDFEEVQYACLMYMTLCGVYVINDCLQFFSVELMKLSVKSDDGKIFTVIPSREEGGRGGEDRIVAHHLGGTCSTGI